MDTEKKQEGFSGQLLFRFTPSEIAYAKQHPIHQHLYATDIGYYPYAANHFASRPDGICSNILIHCVSGQGWFKTDHDRYEVYEGEFFVIPSGIAHQYGSQRDWTIFWVHFEGSMSEKYIAEINNTGYGPKPEPYRNLSIDLFRDLLKCLSTSLTSATISYINYSLSHLLGIYSLHESLHENRTFKHYSTHEIINYMKENIDKNLSLAEMAEYANLSISRFSQVFKKETGYSPVDYYIRLRVQRAAQLLTSTSHKIKHIAILCGWDNPFYFSRSFSKIIGHAPKKYRELYYI